MRRKERRTGSFLVTKEDLNTMRHRVSSFNVESLLTCFALAEHRLYGFGTKRISRTLEYIDSLMDAINNDTASMDDYVRALEEETGVVVKCEDK